MERVEEERELKRGKRRNGFEAKRVEEEREEIELNVIL